MDLAFSQLITNTFLIEYTDSIWVTFLFPWKYFNILETSYGAILFILCKWDNENPTFLREYRTRTSESWHCVAAHKPACPWEQQSEETNKTKGVK